MLSSHANRLRVAFTVAAVLAVIGGIVLAVELQSFWYVVYAAIGATLMLLVAFAMAALLDATETNAEMLQTLMQQAAKPESSAPKTIADAAETIVPTAKTAKRPVPDADGYIVCPLCGDRQKADRTVCFNCGAHFIA